MIPKTIEPWARLHLLLDHHQAKQYLPLILIIDWNSYWWWWWWSWSCGWGKGTSLNCIRVISPKWYMSTKNHAGTNLTKENIWFVHQSYLAILPAVICSRQEECVERIMNLALRSTSVHTCKWFLHAIKSYYMGPHALPSVWGKVYCGFLSPLKKSIVSARFEPANLESNGKHANHYTT
jgi:hypothetical protein